MYCGRLACLVINSITLNKFAAHFNCTPAGRASSLNDGSCLKTFDEVDGGFGWAHRGSTVGFLLFQRFNVGLAVEYSFCFISVLNFDLYVYCFDALISPSCGPNNMYVYESQQNPVRGL